MKNILSSKWFVGLTCLIFGITGTFAFLQLRHEPEKKLVLPMSTNSRNKMGSLLDHFYDDDFFAQNRDPFEQMRKMRKEMMKDFEEVESGGSVFDNWYRNKFGGGDAGEVTKREDSEFIYYDISIKDMNKDNVSVKVKDGQIFISGQVDKKSRDERNASYFSSSFRRAFPVPSEVDESKVQIESFDEKLIIKFPKLAKTTK